MMVPFVKKTTDKLGNEILGAVALGFLLSFKDNRYVVTAGHVAQDSSDLGLQFGKSTTWLNSEELQSGWIYHPDDVIDLAGLKLGAAPKPEGNIFLPERFLVPSKSVELGDDVIFGSIPLYRPDPIILRRGMVAHIQQEGFAIDGQVFPGSSGSPVFLYKNPLRFVGIMVSYMPYEDRAVSEQTGEVRVVFVENSGIGQAHTTDSVRELLEIME
jgi:hypothetical protein